MGDTTTDIDPVTFTILWDRLVAITEEMGAVMRRTGKSEAVVSGQDFSTGLFDEDGNLVAQGNFSPGHLGSMPYAVGHILDEFDRGEFEPGDGVFLNDPYLGSGHLPDLYLCTPIFNDDELQGFAVTVAHQSDVGGMTPGSQAVEATELYQEGLRLLPMRGIEDDDILPWFQQLIEANVRLPETVMGDIRAQQNAAHRGRRLFVELVEEYGADTMRACLNRIFEESEQQMRDAILEIPAGEYRFEDQIDDVGPDTDSVDIAVTVTVGDDEVTLDYAGSDPQTRSAINSYLNYTRAYSIFAIKSVTEKSLPFNAGVARPISVTAPEGSFFNPEPPAACAARAIINPRIFELVMGALADVLPEKVIAGSSHFGQPHFGGVDPETGESFILFDLVIGGLGGSASKDGEEGYCSSFNVSNIPVEIHETRYPVRVDRLELIPDSGGAGRHRGGLGLRKDFTLLADDVTFTNLLERTDSAPWGLHGGEAGTSGRTVLNPDAEATELHAKGTYTLDHGDTVSFQLSGAGGFGDPDDRDPTAVQEDVQKGFVSAEAARKTYGVDLSDGQTEK
jgi:N-methylhydantoinase B